jgi:alpha-ketoglutarate-dependent taurine dioxygenase
MEIFESDARNEAWSARRKNVEPKGLNLSHGELVKLTYLRPDQTLPRVVQPAIDGVKLPAWVRSHRDWIEDTLLQDGGLLFRGFDVNGVDDFDEFIAATGVELMQYMESATPRTELKDKIYTSTEFPPDQTIALHNELTYLNSWPLKIWFCCVQPAERGGATPIANVHKVYERIRPEIREKFIEKGWMLIRNFGGGFGPTWQYSYHLSTRETAEDYFRRAGIDFEWLGGEQLRTSQVRPPIESHPQLGVPLWFNHIAFWHVSSLEPELRALFLKEFEEHELPFNTFYGDGSTIEDSVAEELRQAYQQETVSFPWQAGDVLMLDNMLVAHGREPYSGSRKVLAAMGEVYTRRQRKDVVNRLSNDLVNKNS